MPVAIQTPTAPGGIKSYYRAKIEAAELTINRKTQNLRRLEAQRNALNARGAQFIYFGCAHVLYR
jgi:26S proteasome regulatory subunit T6